MLLWMPVRCVIIAVLADLIIQALFLAGLTNPVAIFYLVFAVLTALAVGVVLVKVQ